MRLGYNLLYVVLSKSSYIFRSEINMYKHIQNFGCFKNLYIYKQINCDLCIWVTICIKNQQHTSPHIRNKKLIDAHCCYKCECIKQQRCTKCNSKLIHAQCTVFLENCMGATMSYPLYASKLSMPSLLFKVFIS